MTPRGIRLNNPGNLRKGDDWQGLAEFQTDPDFCVFTAPLWGIRALAKVLLNYQRKRQLNTVTQIINRWAPPNENNTQTYVADVAAGMHIMADSPISLEDRCTLFLMVETIIRHENGVQPYGGDVIHSALTLAGINSR